MGRAYRIRRINFQRSCVRPLAPHPKSPGIRATNRGYQAAGNGEFAFVTESTNSAKEFGIGAKRKRSRFVLLRFARPGRLCAAFVFFVLVVMKGMQRAAKSPAACSSAGPTTLECRNPYAF